MACIVGGIGVSHAPSIAATYDRGATEEPQWEPLFSGFAEARRWVEALAPDALVVIYNDHVDQFSFRAWPTFALGLADQYEIADEGFGQRPLPPVPGHPELSWHIARSLVADEFDITLCQEMVVDHGVLSPLPLLNLKEGWGARIVPFATNVVLHPLPTPRRCWNLGLALGRAIESYPGPERVIVVGTGGLSHQLTGPRFGDVKPEWDQKFMELLEHDPEQLLSYTHEDFMALGGSESVEVVNWMAMRAALPAGARREYRTYYPHLIMGYGLIAFGVGQAA